MEFGICTSIEKSPAAKAAGFDYIEENVQSLMKGQSPDAEWNGRERAATTALPILAMNSLVPGSLPIVGDSADAAALKSYLDTVLKRSGELGIRTVVFGSGAARMVPDGFSRDTAREQIIRFLRNGMPAAKEHNVTIVVEPLNRGETNIINSVAEGMTYVREVDHPNFQCLVDSYHFWLEDEPLENLRAAMPWIKHVHVADKEGRVAPGLSGKSDYKPFFQVLKAGGYAGRVSYEGAAIPDFDVTAPKIVAYLNKEWAAA
ncbi:MAG TPA: sugar phosphate isomerase/epimerase family protein [Tepidisphaeraceae bacterium]|jgi:sugar phosphate isomerase/epimerase|nr:sugar phosphate isomerase/epimerase family protein [Tepidisphaeraceae bacterium]